MISPGSPLRRSTLMTSWAATRYCFPPVLMTANMVSSSCSVQAGLPRFCSRRFKDLTTPKGRRRGAYDPRSLGVSRKSRSLAPEGLTRRHEHVDHQLGLGRVGEFRHVFLDQDALDVEAFG